MPWLYLCNSGERWESKVGRLRDSLLETGNDAMIVTALDEVAWLFNLRGEDFPKEKIPLFFSYAIVTKNRSLLYISPEKQTQDIKDHLQTEVRNIGVPLIFV